MRPDVGQLRSRKLKCEVRGKALAVATELFVQPLRGDAVNRGEIRVEDNFLAPNCKDQTLDSFRGNHSGFPIQSERRISRSAFNQAS